MTLTLEKIKIINYVLSIPHSNAMSERIFSLMKTAWRSNRKRLTLQNLEAELILKINFEETCKEFRKFLDTPRGKKILKKIRSSEKYQ